MDQNTGGIERVGVVGCGTMGSGITELCARAGSDVLVLVSSDASAEAGRRRVLGSLDRGLAKGKLTEEERAAAVERISFTTRLEHLADRELVVEAIRENEPEKVALFSLLDKTVKARDAILASNTSSFPIMRLARATDRPENVIGLHFFNPVPALPLVEVITSLRTAEDIATRAESYVTTALGKESVRSSDRTGFVVNALLVPYLLSAIRMVESNFASAESIDKGMTLGCAHPMGPLRLVDLIGLDVVHSVALALHEQFKDVHYAPPPMLARMVEAGLLGKKTGRGFYDYR